MRISGVKAYEGKTKIICQLMIMEKVNEDGNYLKMEFTDRTKLIVNIPNSDEKYMEYRELGLNKLMNVEVEIEYKGINTIGEDEYTIHSIKLLQTSLVDCVNIDGIINELRKVYVSIKDDTLRALVDAMCAYDNKDLLKRLFECPYTDKAAYSFKGGTLAHIVRICKLCDVVGNVYNQWDYNLNGFNEQLNVDMLKVIAIFHDLGKAEKYYFDGDEINKTFKGELLSETELTLSIFKSVSKETKLPLLEDQQVLIEHALTSTSDDTKIEPKTKEAEVYLYIKKIEDTMGNYEFMKRISIDDEFQTLDGKKHYVGSFEDIVINDNLAALL